jgi:hypothetical protein
VTVPTNAPAERTTDPLSAGLAAALLALWVVWIGASGGYYGDVWYPSTLALGSVAALLVLAARRRPVLARAPRIALLAFFALVALNYLSMLWAGSKGTALEASNKLVLYALVALVFSCLAWTPRLLAMMLGAWALAIAAFCAVGLIDATSASNLDRFFVQLRWATPLHYSNATAALAVMGMWPALILASRRELAPWLRTLFLPVAVFLAGVAFLPQSRAAVLGLVLTIPIVVAFASDRVRLLARLAIVGGALAFVVPRTVAVDDAISAGHPVGPVLGRAAAGMLLTSLVALLLGALLALLEWRWDRRATRLAPRPSAPGQRPPLVVHGRLASRRARLIVGALVLCLAVGAAAPVVVHETRKIYNTANHDSSFGPTRILSATPEERLDYARVALHMFTSQPILGAGAGNFGPRYDALRHYDKHSKYTHDLALRALSETGIVGLLLLVLVLGGLAYGLIASALRSEGLARACTVAALAIAAYFLVHDSLDWMDEFPALAAPALGFAMAALTLRRPVQARGPVLPVRVGTDARHPLVRVGARAGAALVCLSVLVAVSSAYVASRYNGRALATFRTNSRSAYADVNRAEELNPVDITSVITEGTIALNLGDTVRARAAFQRALKREDNWYPHLQLALLDAGARQFLAADAELALARRLDADDPVIAQAEVMLRQRLPIDPVDFDRLLTTAGDQGQFFRPQNIR